jgi:hypothetical protein
VSLPDLSEPIGPEAADDYRQQAYTFLSSDQEYLADDDLHQASGKGRGAAAGMAKAVSVIHGWYYESHAEFGVALRNAGDLTGNDCLNELANITYALHRSYYTRRRFLSSRTISQSLDRMAELLGALEPLAVPADRQASY